MPLLDMHPGNPAIEPGLRNRPDSSTPVCDRAIDLKLHRFARTPRGGSMGYVEKNLLPNEQVTYRARLHWIIYLVPMIVILAAIAVALVGGGIAAIVVGVIGLLLMLPPWIKSSSSEFAITNKRVLIKVGLVRRHSLELLLQKIEGIGVDQGIIGRILGYGTITVSGVGGTKEAFQRISNPLEFRRQVQASLAT
jgi:membrane protein YdbS with pleckstrin-like domain